jgi:hypothetical protein
MPDELSLPVALFFQSASNNSRSGNDLTVWFWRQYVIKFVSVVTVEHV